MTIYIGADHRGFALKAIIAAALKNDGYEVIDVGAAALDPADDYPDFARAVAEKVSVGGAMSAGAVAGDAGEVRGIVICGSGIGVNIVANKYRSVRSALAISAEQIRAGRRDDDINVLSLAADFMEPEAALAAVRAFLLTPFKRDEERFSRRLGKIAELENKP
jgi:ribose 5-phosphate isomerase B